MITFRSFLPTSLRHIAWGVLPLCVGAAGMFSYVTFFNLISMPLQQVTSIQEADGIAYVGGKIQLIVTLVPGRLCPSRTDRVLWRSIDDPSNPDYKIPEIHKLESGSIVVPLGARRFIVSIDIPDDIEPGDWWYVSRTSYECPWWDNLNSAMAGRTNPTQSPNIPMFIQPKR
jgi:hypothetical protein